LGTPTVEDGTQRVQLALSGHTLTHNPLLLWERAGGGTSHWVASAAGPVEGTPPAGHTDPPAAMPAPSLPVPNYWLLLAYIDRASRGHLIYIWEN
jgi:hypothetical protein